MNRLRRLTAVLCVLAVAGCGVPSQDAPVRVAAGDIPSPLAVPETPGPTAPPTVRPGRSAVVVYFVRDELLVGLAREAPGNSPADRLTAVADALVAGPTEREQAAGLVTTLPPGLELRLAGLEDGRLQLELIGETDGRSATENVLAVGQIVLSLTALATVDEITFVRDGAPVEALLPGGALTADPLTAADYAPLRDR